MTSAGWYPDPSDPTRVRFWDGGAWTEQTADTPPVPTVPPPPAPQASWPATRTSPPAAPPTPPRRGRTALLVALVVVLLAGLGTAGVLALRSGDDDPRQATEPDPTGTGDPTDPESTTPSPTDPEPTSAPPAPQPAFCTAGNPGLGPSRPDDGLLHGGGLAMPLPEGYQRVPAQRAFPFARDVVVVARPLVGDFVTLFSLGQVRVEDGQSPQEVAEAVLDCIGTSPQIYPTEGRIPVPVSSEATTVDGQDAWSARGRVPFEDGEIRGGDLEVIAVDTGDPGSVGVFTAIMSLGDRETIDQRTQVVRTLVVE